MSYKKGRSYEEETVRIARGHGKKMSREALSGQKLNPDLWLEIPKWGCEIAIEQKVRKNGFKRIYKWLEGKDALIIKGIGVGKRLIVIEFERFLNLI